MQIVKLTTLAAIMAGTALLPAAAFADAETFVGVSTSEVTGVITMPGRDDNPIATVTIKGVSNATYSGGRTDVTDFTCTSMTQPPASLFAMHGQCDATGPDGGTFGIIFGCNYASEDRTVTTCYGGLIGKTGSFEGRRGSVNWHGPNADGKTISTGQWHN